MSEFHTEIIKTIAAQMRPNLYVELGVADCSNLNVILPWVNESWACDLNGYFVHGISKSESHKVKAFGGSTRDFAAKWKSEIKREIDLIFIDADHSKEAVWEDVSNFYPFLRTDTGIMILHDVWPPARDYTSPGYCGDCYRLKDKIKRDLPNVEYVSLPYQYGVGIIRKVGDDWRNKDR